MKDPFRLLLYCTSFRKACLVRLVATKLNRFSKKLRPKSFAHTSDALQARNQKKENKKINPYFVAKNRQKSVY
jgi:hypothetical protein